jgi:hypothetical protein
MKFKIVKIGIALLMTAALLVLSGCPKEAEETVFSDDAELTGISVNSKAVVTLPEAVSKEEWDAPVFDFSSMPNGVFVINEADLSDATVSATTNHSGAKLQYGRGTNSEGPVAWNKTGKFNNLTKTDVLYVSVMSESGNKRNFYKVRMILSADTSLATLRQFEVNGSMVRLTGATNPNEDQSKVVPGTVWVDSALRSAALLNVVPDNENTIITGGVVFREGTNPSEGDYGVPFFNALSATWELDEGDVLWVKTESFDHSTTLYYAALIRIYNHISLTINAKPVALIGQGGGAGDTANFGSVTITAEDASAGKVIKATPLAGSGAKVTGYQTATAGPSATAWVDPDANGAYIREAAIPNANYLCIRIEDKYEQLYYYRVYIVAANDNVALGTGNALTVGGIAIAAANRGTPQAAAWSGTENTGSVTIGKGVATADTVVVATTANTSAIRTWAVAANATTIPPESAYTASAIVQGIKNGEYLFIKIVSQDGTVTTYYKIAVTVSTDANSVTTLASATINGAAITLLPTSGTSWTAAAQDRQFTTAPASVTWSATLHPTAVGATINYAYGTGNTVATAPENWQSTPITLANPANLTYIAVRVTAENGTTFGYYRWRIVIGSPSTGLASASINGAPVAMAPVNIAATWPAASNITVSVVPFGSLPTTASLTVTPAAGTTPTISYAYSATGTAPTDWSDTPVSISPVNGSYLGVRVVSEDTLTTAYYRWRISAATLSAVTIAGRESDILNLFNVAANGTTVTNIYLTSAEAAAGRQIVVTTPNNASIKIGTATSNSALATNYVDLTKTGTGPYTHTGVIPGETALANNSTRIIVEVTNGTTVAYYKFTVMTTNNAALTGLTIGGKAFADEAAAAALGSPAASWNTPNLTAGTVALSAAQAVNAAIVPTTGTNPGVITYAVTKSLTAAPVFGTLPVTGFTFANNDYLYIRLEYQASGNVYRNIYRIQISVQ